MSNESDLIDYEALQAECERLRDERDALKR
jgi:hypothetical protein